jgi:hypothetical protein
MLQGKRLDGNGGAIGIEDGRAEKANGFGDAFAMVIERAVGEVGERALAGIEPVMERKIVGDRTTVGGSCPSTWWKMRCS